MRCMYICLGDRVEWLEGSGGLYALFHMLHDAIVSCQSSRENNDFFILRKKEILHK